MKLAEMQAAAKVIEIDGDEGFLTCAQRFGVEAALLLLIAHLRRGFGAMESCPPDPLIDKKVEEHVSKILKGE